MSKLRHRWPPDPGHVLAGAAIALLLAMPVRALAAAPAQTPDPRALDTGLEATAERSVAFRQRVEARPLFAHARSLYGEPLDCRISWETFEGQDFGTIDFRFPGGSQLKLSQHPPEVTIMELRSKRSLDLEAAKRVLEEESGYGVDWSQAPEVRHEEESEVMTFWHPEEGLNLGVDLVYHKGQLVGLGYHSAP